MLGTTEFYILPRNERKERRSSGEVDQKGTQGEGGGRRSVCLDWEPWIEGLRREQLPVGPLEMSREGNPFTEKGLDGKEGPPGKPKFARKTPP